MRSFAAICFLSFTVLCFGQSVDETIAYLNNKFESKNPTRKQIISVAHGSIKFTDISRGPDGSEFMSIHLFSPKNAQFVSFENHGDSMGTTIFTLTCKPQSVLVNVMGTISNKSSFIIVLGQIEKTESNKIIKALQHLVSLLGGTLKTELFSSD